MFFYIRQWTIEKVLINKMEEVIWIKVWLIQSPGMVDTSSYVLVSILSFPITLLGTYAVKNVSMIDWLHKKFPVYHYQLPLP